MKLPELGEQDFAHLNQRPFTPFSHQDGDGDCIEFIMSPHSYYGKRLDELLTVYLSTEDDSVAGFLIKKVSKIMKNPGLQMAYRYSEGKVRVDILLTNYFSVRPDAFTQNEPLAGRLLQTTYESAPDAKVQMPRG